MTKSLFGRGALTALAVVLIAAPLISGSQYILSVAIITLMFGYLALSWNVLGGIAGQLSLGHAAYFGIGAYTSTWLFGRLGISPWLGMWAGVALAILAAVLIGAACFRLRGAYFALATIAASVVLKTLVENADSLLGGSRGMEVPLLHDAPLYFQHTSKEFYFVIIAVLTAVALLVNWAILRSRFGYYLTAIRNDQEAAQALGVNTTRYKLLAAIISAGMTAIGGTFYAQFVMYIAPEIVFGVNFSVVIAVICIIGGRGTLWGPLLGALLLHPAEELARHVSGGMVGVDMMLYGLILMIVIRVQPNGLVAILKKISTRRQAAGKAQQYGTT
ncbi:branched-chain amino acid ABC transporter permease [Noviherbaspirillum sedimenti]|uniref:Branched-chain amino acid ABC transporter permease n=1 Tax=Noviherbaspirillum sedimenti TaxID=2320865 RepID=A0A3A3G2D8_9BURK|nr:branched-chain amino acid ABC transporter permease [Noviherbaspirillum sedimenti]RJG02091.1 branched-chain amino acid ABC transporter permease [Noviherbaspirillum sedimenti]